MIKLGSKTAKQRRAMMLVCIMILQIAMPLNVFAADPVGIMPLVSTPDLFIFDIADGGIVIKRGAMPGSCTITYGTGLTVLAPAGQEITIFGTSASHSIAVQDGAQAHITLEGVNVNRGATAGQCAFSVADGAAVNLTLAGYSSLNGGSGAAALRVAPDAALTIDEAAGGGALNVVAGNHGAGIGGNAAETGGAIEIAGGNITVMGGSETVGIGGGFGGAGGAVTISGGSVNINMSGNGAVGIGAANGAGGVLAISGGAVKINLVFDGTGIGVMGGSGGEIDISGGTVEVSTGTNGIGIGGGGAVRISGGTVEATANGVGAAIGGGAAVEISGGTVKATARGSGAGIGGTRGNPGGIIEISGGNVAARSGSGGGAGIGGGSAGASGSITISGGHVVAGAEGIAAGIGSGTNGAAENITISGGTIYASTISKVTAAIGGTTSSSAGFVTITGGSIGIDERTTYPIFPQPTNGDVPVYSNALTLGLGRFTAEDGVGVKELSIDGTSVQQSGIYGIHDVVTQSNGKVFFWLGKAAGAHTGITVTADDDEVYLKHYSRTGESETETLLSQTAPDPWFVIEPTGSEAVYEQGDSALPVGASSALEGIEGFSITYRWYCSEDNVAAGGTALGESGAVFTPSTEDISTLYYYCVATLISAYHYYPSSMVSTIQKVTVNPRTLAEVPDITQHPESAAYVLGTAAAALSVAARVGDGGTLTYQWHSSADNDTNGASVLGATGTTLIPPTDTVGTVYYYCVVTNTASGMTATATSNVAAITVNKPTPTLEHLAVGETEVTYNGSPQPLAITSDAGKLDGALLGAITVWYEGTAGTAYAKTTIAPTGAGKYKITADIAQHGSDEAFEPVAGLEVGDYTIHPKDITHAMITLQYDEIVYTGNENRPGIIHVEVDGIEVTGYGVEYEDSLNAGDEAIVRITAVSLSNFTGVAVKLFGITPYIVTDPDFIFTIPAIVYDGEAHTATPSDFVVTCYGKTLMAGIDYIVDANGLPTRTDVGVSQAHITGTGNFEGPASADFVITPADIASATVIIDSAVYDGKPQTPVVKVIWQGKELQLGKDYTLAQNDAQTAVGAYPVTITGLGNFKGTVTEHFVIRSNADGSNNNNNNNSNNNHSSGSGGNSASGGSGTAQYIIVYGVKVPYVIRSGVMKIDFTVAKLNEILEAAGENTTFGADARNKAGATVLEVSFPPAWFAEHTDIRVPVQSDAGGVTLGGNLAAQFSQSSTATVTIQGGSLTFAATQGGKPVMWHKTNAPVVIYTPYTLKSGESANTVVLYDKTTGEAVAHSFYLEGRMYGAVRAPGEYGVKTVSFAFADTAGHWGEVHIGFTRAHGILNGTSNTHFSPNMTLTRGMFVTALGRLSGADVSGYVTSSFVDVEAGKYYLPYIEWASANNIVLGVGDGKFAPEREITREQMVVMMSNYAAAIGHTLPKIQAENIFGDSGSTSAWAKHAVTVTQQAGIIAGKPGNLFDPQGLATRAEAATILRRFAESVVIREALWIQATDGHMYVTLEYLATVGWLTTDAGARYYFDENGFRISDQWLQIDGQWYYFLKDGKLATGTTVDGYTIGEDGIRSR